MAGARDGLGSTHTDVERRIEDAVFGLMRDTPVPQIKVRDVVHAAHVSRSTFYRHYRDVDDVVKRFESGILDNMRSVNKNALNVRFGKSEIDPTAAMISRMRILHDNRDKIVALNGPNGDPTFVHKATVFMHDYFRKRLRDVPGNDVDRDLYLSFVLAGHNNLVEYWLEEHPEIAPERIAAVLNRLYYAPFFLDEETMRDVPRSPQFGASGSRRGTNG